MNIIAILQRKIANADPVRNNIGELFRKLDTWKKFCYTLEDEIRPDHVKVFGETCIEAGIYEMKVTYSPKFKRETVELFPKFETTKTFTGLRMHGGQDESHTHGCPCIAYNVNPEKTRIFGTAEKEWTAWVKEQLKAGRCYIEIQNRQISSGGELSGEMV